MIVPPKTRSVDVRATSSEMLEALYDDLKRVAAGKLTRERADHTLQATALVHEAFLRLRNDRVQQGWDCPSDFVAAAAEAMRRILVDHARARLSSKRGGRSLREPLTDQPLPMPLSPDDVLSVHTALDELAAEDPIKAQLVKLRLFVGMDHLQAAKELGISRATADRYWSYAKVRLYTLIEGQSSCPTKS
ncbi:MAG: ECF-type sigma factor [Planctomycetota bacterium]